MQDNKENFKQETNRSYVFGRNAVTELLRSNRDVDKLYILKGAAGGPLVPIIEKCRTKKIPVKEVPAQKLDFMCGNQTHQGVIASVAAKSYCSLDDILNICKDKSTPPFLIICDGLEDPHNLGAIIRTAEATDVDGIIIPRHRSVTLSATVAKSASGALEYVNICKVTNVADTIEKLKENGFWVWAADMDGQNWFDADFSSATAIVIGSEGKGVSRLVKSKCDGTISMPMQGQINSLNASVAAGVLMYEVVKQRLK